MSNWAKQPTRSIASVVSLTIHSPLSSAGVTQTFVSHSLKLHKTRSKKPIEKALSSKRILSYNHRGFCTRKVTRPVGFLDEFTKLWRVFPLNIHRLPARARACVAADLRDRGGSEQCVNIQWNSAWRLCEIHSWDGSRPIYEMLWRAIRKRKGCTLLGSCK